MNGLSYVSTDDVRTEPLRDAWAAPTREVARARIAGLIDALRRKVPALAEWAEETAEQTLADYDLPAGAHRLRLRSTSLEHDTPTSAAAHGGVRI